MLNKGAVTVVTFYQEYVSPMLPMACRFHPTCSQYAKDAYGKYPFFYGTWLVIKRLSKCHPLHPGGLDPVR